MDERLYNAVCPMAFRKDCISTAKDKRDNLPQVQGTKWVSLGTTMQGNELFHDQIIWTISTGLMVVDTKLQFSDEGRKDYIQLMNLDAYQYTSLSYGIGSWEINCVTRERLLYHITLYSADGQKLGPTIRKPPELATVTDGMEEKLHKVACPPQEKK
jgi:hypothetical protein